MKASVKVTSTCIRTSPHSIYIYDDYAGEETHICIVTDLTQEHLLAMNINIESNTVTMRDYNTNYDSLPVLIQQVLKKQPPVNQDAVLKIKFIGNYVNPPPANGRVFNLKIDIVRQYCIVKGSPARSHEANPDVLKVKSNEQTEVYILQEASANTNKSSILNDDVVDRISHLGPLSWYFLLAALSTNIINTPIGNYITMHVDKQYHLVTHNPETLKITKATVINGKISNFK